MTTKPEETINTTLELIEALCSESRATQLIELLNSIGTEHYFSAPASSRESYHNCFPGGFAQHNINVLRNLIILNEQFNFGFSDEAMCVVAILHDIGKVLNTDCEPYYQLTDEKWKINKGETYQGVQGKVFLPTHQRSVWLCQHFNFKLSPEEYQAILLNDGQHVQENKVYSMKECQLAQTLHMADLISLSQEKKNETPKSV